MRLVLKADASPVLGAGHVMRSLAIAEEAISRNIDTFFAGTISDADWLYEKTKSVPGLLWIDNLESFVVDPKRDFLLLDSYSLPLDCAFIKPSRWKCVIAIVDQLTPSYEANLKIHPGLVHGHHTLSNVLSGPNYIPLRKTITKSQKVESVPLKVIVVGGGTNIHKVVNFIASELQHLEFEFQTFLFSEQIDDKLLVDARFERVPIGADLDAIAEEADLVFTTASTTSMEFIAREKAVGVTCAVDNQREYYLALTESGLAAPIGVFENHVWNLNSQVIRQLVLDKKYRENLIKRTENLIDLQGSKRIVDKIISML